MNTHTHTHRKSASKGGRLFQSLVYLSFSFFSFAQLNIGTSTTPQSTPNEVRYSQLSSAEKTNAQNNGINIQAPMTLIVDEDITFQYTASVPFTNTNYNPPIQITVGILVNEGNVSTNGATLRLEATVKSDLSAQYDPLEPRSIPVKSWKGIGVIGDLNSSHFFVDPDPSEPGDKDAFKGDINPIHGKVILGANARIQGAHVGVYSYNRGIVEAFDVMVDRAGISAPVFHNNKVGLRVENSTSISQNSSFSVSATRLNNVSFQFDQFAANAFSARDFAHINAGDGNYKLTEIVGSKGIFFGGCDFSNKDNSRQRLVYYNQATGIRLHNILSGLGGPDVTLSEPSIIVGEAGDVFYTPAPGSGFDESCTYQKVQGYEDETEDNPRFPGTQKLKTFNSSFESLSFALVSNVDPQYKYIDAEGYAEKVSISNTTFTNNFQALNVNARQADIHDCSFTTSDAGLDQYWSSFSFDGDEIILAQVEDVSELLFYNNTLSSDVAAYGQRQASLIVNGVGSARTGNLAKKVLVRYNDFEGDASGSTPATHGFTAEGNLANLEWTCNTFANNDIDVSYSGSVGPNKNPYSKSAPANNTYDGTILEVENNTGITLEYLVVPNGDIISDDYFKTEVPSGENPLCAIECNELEDLRDNLDPGLVNIPERTKGNLKAYPNPSNGTFFIPQSTANELENGIISLVTLSGVTAWETSFRTGESQFSATSIVQGMYILKIETENSVHYDRILVQQ